MTFSFFMIVWLTLRRNNSRGARLAVLITTIMKMNVMDDSKSNLIFAHFAWNDKGRRQFDAHEKDEATYLFYYKE